MCEILFKGKRVDNGEWVEGYYYKAKFYRDDTELCDYITVPHPSENGRGNEHFMVIPETVGRYTGLRDCKRTEEYPEGQKIFEGDIVKGKDALAKGFEIYGYIDHQNGSFVIVGEAVTHYRWLDYEVEVIGNITDNPELIGGEENA